MGGATHSDGKVRQSQKISIKTLKEYLMKLMGVKPPKDKKADDQSTAADAEEEKKQHPHSTHQRKESLKLKYFTFLRNREDN